MRATLLQFVALMLGLLCHIKDRPVEGTIWMAASLVISALHPPRR